MSIHFFPRSREIDFRPDIVCSFPGLEATAEFHFVRMSETLDREQRINQVQNNRLTQLQRSP